MVADETHDEAAGETAAGADDRQGHGDHLSSLDAAFLEMESDTRHMHVGGLFVFDPPEDGRRVRFPHFLELVRSRLHLIPRYRQKVVVPPLQLGSPRWVDDPDFDLSYHVRHAALPEPGTTAQLTEYASRILSRQLDRSRPLWELYVIEGLEHGRIALLGKTHHAMVDGMSGIDIATVVLDVSPDQSDTLPEPAPWTPRPTPTPAELATDALRDLATSPAHLAESVGRVAKAPRVAAAKAFAVGAGVARVARKNLVKPAPRSILNQPPGRSRRFAIQRIELERVKAIKRVFGTTVNDVILAVVADGTGRYLRHRGVETDGLWLRAMVPVSTRSASESHHLGNRVVSVFVDLPMMEMDPIERLRVCHDAMASVKRSHAAVGAGFLIGLGEFAPPTLHAMASRLAVNTRVFNFLVTNVPGPQLPIYCLGARLLGGFPFTPLAANHSYGIGVTSLDGWLNVGIVADYDALPDVDVVPDMLVGAVEDLATCALAVSEKPSLSDRAASAGPGFADDVDRGSTG
ncbi:MAG: wax ester/triacylglycerol synthase family O-acyltransferase [Nitriliruptoraceae bacterium]|nr:wax ester/triacylglycerol synthase family O-acyltransferase [Nitriliruptoraceae bacterium]